MKSKAKWFLLGLFVTSLVAPLPSCGLLPGQDSNLTSEYVTAIIVSSAVPYTDYYYQQAVGEEEYQASGGIGEVTPFGQWAGSYQGDGIWKVQGAVATRGWGNCITTWIFDESTGEISLSGFNCD